MIRVFKVIGSIEEVDTMNVDARSLFISVESTNISHRNNTSKVTFALFVVDKSFSDDEDALVLSMQENIFVIGQVQDFILSIDNDVEFGEVTIAQAPSTDYNLSAAVCTFEVDFDKNISCGTESLNSSYDQDAFDGSFEYALCQAQIDQWFQSTTYGTFSLVINYDHISGGVPAAEVGKTLKIELMDYLGRSLIFSRPNQLQTVIAEDIRSTFPENVELRVRIWLEDPNSPPGKRYIKDPANALYEEVMFSYGRYFAMAVPANAYNMVGFGLGYNSTTALTSEYTQEGDALVRRSESTRSIMYEANLMRADTFNGPYTSVYSQNGTIANIPWAGLPDGNIRVLFRISQATTPLAYACSNHTTQLVGRFYLTYKEQIVGFDGNLKWGFESLNHNHYTLTDSSNSLVSC